ncbi:hypothetical protein KIPB_013015, partial [Kipferlia bialata]
IAAGAWDWGWLIMLGLEIALIVTMLHFDLLCNLIERGYPEKRQFYFMALLSCSVLFAAESALRFYLVYITLSMQHEYWQAPRSTHMYYGPYFAAALLSACVSVVWLGSAVIGEILQIYPLRTERFEQKRVQFFDRHGTPRVARGM